jgi:hypothetical protein
VDDRGEVDPTPALISFDRRTVLPSVRVDRPARLRGYLDAQAAPSTVAFGYTGVDPDGPRGIPAQVRFIWKQAGVGDPFSVHYVRTKYEFDQRVEELMSFDDPAWGDWMPYSPNPQHRQVTFADQPQRDEQDRLITYLFGLQVMDETGAVSIERSYGQNVHNVYVTTSMTPLLTVYEPNLGMLQATGVNTVRQFEIAGGQNLNFSWIASAERYAGLVENYRYGWDVSDPEDDLDPHWAVPPGFTSQHLSSPEISFVSGVHRLIVQCRDNAGQITRLTVILNVVPVPAPQAQRPLLMIDDVRDRSSWSWIGPDLITPLDRDPHRDAFWVETLAGQGGVLDFSPDRDVMDAEVESFGYRELVDYRAVVWTTRYAHGNYIWDHFKPSPPGSPPHLVWLRTYQEGVGNLLMSGPRSMNSFIEERQWMLPIYLQEDFGELELPDGTVVPLGTLSYPYRGMGLAVLDHVMPRYLVWPTMVSGSAARSSACSGVKGLVLDADFKAAHMPGGAFADTIDTEPTIDWQDLRPAYHDSLKAYNWGGDEFYDGNITGRPDTWTPQQCGGVSCVEPMFRIYSRFDWVDDLHLCDGDPDWPAPIYSEQELEAVCGLYALDEQTGRTRITGQVLGLVSYRTIAKKPGGRGDVLWGFDPYRFDHGEVRKVIQWVLGDQLGLVMKP